MNNTNDPTIDLPKFCDIDPKHIEPELEQKITHILEAIKALIAPEKHYTWENLMEPKRRIDRSFSLVLGPH